MSHCERLPTCRFFVDQVLDLPGVAALLKSRYCKGDYASCARLKVLESLGSQEVPRDLFPNQVDRAEEMLVG